MLRRTSASRELPQRVGSRRRVVHRHEEAVLALAEEVRRGSDAVGED